jgi:hypothetical protein
MVSDLALFEPKQRGIRAYDHCLRDHGRLLIQPTLALTQRMARARFRSCASSVVMTLRAVWVEDVINPAESIWVLDQGLEVSAPFGLRIFDAGDFHAGFGIVVPADPEITNFCAQAVARGNRLPVRHSLAATLYADAIWDEWMRVEEEDRAAPVDRSAAHLPRGSPRSVSCAASHGGDTGSKSPGQRGQERGTEKLASEHASPAKIGAYRPARPPGDLEYLVKPMREEHGLAHKSARADRARWTAHLEDASYRRPVSPERELMRQPLTARDPRLREAGSRLLSRPAFASRYPP